MAWWCGVQVWISTTGNRQCVCVGTSCCSHDIIFIVGLIYVQWSLKRLDYFDTPHVNIVSCKLNVNPCFTWILFISLQWYVDRRWNMTIAIRSFPASIIAQSHVGKAPKLQSRKHRFEMSPDVCEGAFKKTCAIQLYVIHCVCLSVSSNIKNAICLCVLYQINTVECT